MTRAPVHPALLTWARERAGLPAEALTRRFPKLRAWERGEAQPTLRQLEDYARAVHVPLGYLFLPEPPEERLPIPDFRTLEARPPRRPSPDLLETLYAAQERQDWYRDLARTLRLPGVDFVGTVGLEVPPHAVAARIAERIGFDVRSRENYRTWEEALHDLVELIEGSGVLVMTSGIVGANTHRKLDPQEFRGFALADRRAPLIFVNGADTKSAQMFTLAHELAHLWLGTSAVSDAGPAPGGRRRREEVWCNKVAAELLVPREALREAVQPEEPVTEAVQRLTRRFKVSTLVILRRLLDLGTLERAEFEAVWETERARLQEITEHRKPGGDFYRSTLSRVSRRFARALVESTLEGQTLYRDAFRMLGVKKTETFDEIARRVGVLP
jgi:Zn-dependent peptidase ImmA (M78 family)